jgi:uncharacterized membrane protein YdjX (TVP38/TMEM64 family)
MGHIMKTHAQHYGLLALLLVGIGVTWLKRDACTLEAATAWVQYLGSGGPFMFAGFYGLAPTLHLRGAMPSMAGEMMCGNILGMVVILMGTTSGVMVAYLLARALAGLWRVARAASLPGAVQLSLYKGKTE